MIAQSESLTDKFANICRLCLKEESPMLSIFTTTTTTTNATSGPEDEQQSLLAARITSIAQVQISPDDGLPAYICQLCRRQVDKFYEFRLLVEISDRTLRSCFERVHGEAENERMGLRVVENMEYQEYLVESESPEDEKDLFSVNAILVPSASGMQVWQICSAEEKPIQENRVRYKMQPEECVDVCPKVEYQEEMDDSRVEDFEVVKRRLGQQVTPLGIKRIDREETLYYAATINSCEEAPNDSERLSRVQIIDEPDYEEEHLTLEEYNCQLCLKSFQTLEALKKHVSDHFLGENKKRVPTSARGESGTTSATTTAENAEKTKDNRLRGEDGDGDDDDDDDAPEYLDSLTCDSCDEMFETMEERILHARRNLTVEGPKCRYCGRSFSKLSSRNFHEQTVHEQSVDDASVCEAHKCDDCGKVFAKRSELRYHKGTHTSSPSTCTICNKHFRNVQSFKMHVKRHTLGSRYNCEECGKSYYTNSELARHVQQHTGTREYPCHLCEMSFLSKPELNRHFKYHNGEKKFKCKLCFKTYYESGHLKVHERVHTGERPFSCTVCQKGFITKSKLVRHLKIHDRTRPSRQDDANIERSVSISSSARQ